MSGNPLNALGMATSLSLPTAEKRFLNERHNGDAPFKMLLHESEIEFAVQRIADGINLRFDPPTSKPLLLVGILTGAFVFVSDLCKRLTVPHEVMFIQASSYTGQQQGEMRILSEIIPSKINGRHVILLDELFDNGHTMQTMKEFLIRHPDLDLEPSDIETCVLFSKRSGTEVAQPDVVGIPNLPPLWLVGYGLDDNGDKRGWPHLFAIPKPEGFARAREDAIFETEECYDANAYAKLRHEILDKSLFLNVYV